MKIKEAFKMLIKEGKSEYLFNRINNVRAIISNIKVNTDLKQFKKKEIDNIVDYILNEI